MNIAYVSDQRYPAIGTDTIQVATMCSAFGAAGARVTLYYLADDPGRALSPAELARHYEIEANFDTVPLSSPGKPLRGIEKMILAERAAQRISGSSADLIYSRNLPVILAGLRRTDLPVFYETYRPWPIQRRHKAWLFRRMRRAERFRGLILHSQLAADSYREVGFAPERLLVALNGHNPASLNPRLTRHEARRSLGLADGFTVTYAGDVMPGKGLDIVLDIAVRLPEIRFLLVGSKSRNRIDRRAEKMANVRIFGWRKISEVSPFLFAADVLVIPPSRAPLERRGHTVLPVKSFYYLAAGRPILAGDTPDVREVVVPGRNGILVPPGDVHAAAAALKLLMRSPEECERLGATARADGSARTWSARADAILGFLGQRIS